MKIYILVLSALMFSSCDNAAPVDLSEVEVKDPGVELVPQSDVSLSNGHMSFRLYRGPLLSRVYMQPGATHPYRQLGGASVVGLWMASDQDGFRSHNTGSLPRGMNGFRLTQQDSVSPGIFVITKDSLSYPIDNWPTALGAPSDGERIPKLYGDHMAWLSQEPVQGTLTSNSMIPGLRIGKSVFMFDTKLLNQAVFIRFDISNTSEQVVSNLHLGIEADLDLDLQDNSDRDWCGEVFYQENSSGYDLQRHLSYVYANPSEIRSYEEECVGYVAGFSILDLHASGGLNQPKLAHRIIRERFPPDYSEFSELLINTDEAVFQALRGLAPDGSPMVDPVTGSESRFAFTGDPVSQTGWLDVREDIRGLQSIEPFNLQAGETRSLMVVLVTAQGENLDDGLRLLKQNFDVVLILRSFWDY